MPNLFLPEALLPSGWARDVRVWIDPTGTISDVWTSTDPADAERVAGVAVPGVPNAHSHAFQRGLAGLAERAAGTDDTFWSWRRTMYDFVARVGPDDVEAIAAQLYVELLRHGFTAVAEFHYLRDAPDGTPYDDPCEMARRVLSAADVAGIGVTMLPTVYTSSGFGGALPDAGQRRFTASVDELLRDVDTLIGTSAARVGLALHSLRAVPPARMREALSGLDAADPTAPIHIHVAEQLREVAECLEWSDQRPVEWLLEHAWPGPRWTLVHATHMTPEETRELAERGAVVALCPTTEANLGDGLFPLSEYRAAGGTFSVGTDSHVSVSPVAELRMLEYGQRLTRRLRNVAATDEHPSTGRALLECAWAGGAASCGRPLGRIEPGARADLVVLDPDHPALAGRSGDALLDSWLFAGEDTPVKDVMVGGAWVVRDGRHARQDEIALRYREVASGLTS